MEAGHAARKRHREAVKKQDLSHIKKKKEKKRRTCKENRNENGMVEGNKKSQLEE